MASFGRAVCALKSITGVIALVLTVCMVTLWLDMRNGSKAGIARIQVPRHLIFDNQTVIPSLAPSVNGADTGSVSAPFTLGAKLGPNGVCQRLLSAPFTPAYLSGAPVGKPEAGSPAVPGGLAMPRSSPCYGYEHLGKNSQKQISEYMCDVKSWAIH
jgi:hypothetical protein